MSLAVAAATGALVIPAELPDKTFISCVVLSSRHRALPVWIGCAFALTLQALLAVVAGRLLALLPHETVQIVVAVLFMAGAAFLLFVPERSEEAKGERLGMPKDKTKVTSDWRIVLMTFTIVALAEFGDVTQILIANLTARYRDPVGVFVGAAIGFCIVSGLGVGFGKTITRAVPLGVVRRFSGLALLGLGVYTIVSLAT